MQLRILEKEEPKFLPVVNDMSHKPNNGLWTSTFNMDGKYASDWVEWCSSEMPHWIRDRKAVLIKVKEDARIFVVDSLEDLYVLIRKYPRVCCGRDCIDFEKASQKLDGIRLTSRGQYATRFSIPTLYGWDCESTLFFRDVFEKTTQFLGELIKK